MQHFLDISKKMGESVIFAQGAGGNSSVKLGDKMYVKASGSFLKDMRENFGYVCCKSEPIRKYIFDNKDLEVSQDFETRLNGFIASNVVNEESFGVPSIETGFHAVLPQKYILHSHNIYANVFNCMKGGESYLRGAFSDYKLGFVDYFNPGATLSCAIAKYLMENSSPEIIFLKNHGVITASDDARHALELMNEVNYHLVEMLKKRADFIEFEVREVPADFSFHLFPDSVVYSQINLENLSGEKRSVFYQISSVVNYILERINNLGGVPEFLRKEDVDFIKNMEKEKLRLSMLKVL